MAREMIKKIETNLDFYDNLPYNIILEQWDEEGKPYWVARVAELPHCMIDGDTPEEAIKEIQVVKREWIESNLKRGLKIPEPAPRQYSGQIRLRITPTLHKLLSDRAGMENVSLNHYMSTVLAQATGFMVKDAPSSTAKKRKTGKR